jgi:hypothetical protein
MILPQKWLFNAITSKAVTVLLGPPDQEKDYQIKYIVNNDDI